MAVKSNVFPFLISVAEPKDYPSMSKESRLHADKTAKMDFSTTKFRLNYKLKYKLQMEVQIEVQIELVFLLVYSSKS